MGQNFMPSFSFIHPRGILKGSGIFLSLIFSLGKYSVFKSASTSTAVLIGLTPFSLATNTENTRIHEFWDNSSVPLNSF